MKRREFIVGNRQRGSDMADGGARAAGAGADLPHRWTNILPRTAPHRCSQAISPCVEVVRVAVIAEIFGCPSATA
jgi:hypothetical protein